MRSAVFATIAFAAAALASPMPQGVTENIAPEESTPDGCQTTYDGSFNIEVVNATTVSKRDVEKRDVLVVTLADGVLKDGLGRTGYIADNNQFQFDAPAQTGAIYTAGWSVCSNGTLALGDSAIFYQCLSGTFYNLYDENTADQCSPVFIYVINTNAKAANSLVASQLSDGQINATPIVTQIGDGQIQAATAATGVPVTQIDDGQIQAATGNPVSQIDDGQIQAPTGNPVSQIGDGQIQAPTGNPVSQISDGQIQAPTATGNVVTQIDDGQIQAPTATGNLVTQISDGQIQAATAPAAATSSVVAYTGAAAPNARGELFGLAAGIVAVAAML